MTVTVTPTLTVGLPNFGPRPEAGWRQLLDLARAAEAAGVDRVVVVDHVVMGRNTHEYAWGPFPYPPEAPWLEPLTVLAAVGAVTERLRLATGILVAPLRPAALLAKTAATVDQLTGGRLDLGVGVGWQREEFDAVGLDFDRRGELLTDVVAACRALWEDLPASFSSAAVRFDDTFCAPQPVQARLPVLFSGVLHRRNVDRIARLGDGWIPIMGASLDEIRAGVDRLRRALEGAGRDPGALQVRAPVEVARDGGGRPDLDGSMASVPRLVAAGVTDVRVDLRLAPGAADDPAAACGALVEAFRRHAPA
ncbi:MAG TPA: TIGR03619 family F420-dependent LLM class oxidoreductase [Acidimicrobiales bacterium]